MQPTSSLGQQSNLQNSGLRILSFSRWVAREYETAATRRLHRRVRLWGACIHYQVPAVEQVAEINNQNRSNLCQ